MSASLRVMIERGRKKRVVACAFDWPGWDRSSKTEPQAVAVLEAYRPRYATVARLAGQDDAFGRVGQPEVVERIEGIGMTDYFGVSCLPATPERIQVSEAECERKLALLRAAWQLFDATAARVPNDLTLGPRGGGRDRDTIVRHVRGAEIVEWAPKVGIRVPLETREDAAGLSAYRDSLCDAIRAANAAGPMARTWTVQFLIRRATWHALDHAWEMEDRDPASASTR